MFTPVVFWNQSSAPAAFTRRLAAPVISRLEVEKLYLPAGTVNVLAPAAMAASRSVCSRAAADCAGVAAAAVATASTAAARAHRIVPLKKVYQGTNG